MGLIVIPALISLADMAIAGSRRYSAFNFVSVTGGSGSASTMVHGTTWRCDSGALKSVRAAVAFFGLLCFAVPVLAQQTGRVNLEFEPLQPLPQVLPLNADKIALGRDLFFDKRLFRLSARPVS